MYHKKDDVDVYRIRTYKIPLGSSGKNSAADVELIQHRIGMARVEAAYDPVGGYRGLEWTFEATGGELFMFYQQYGVWYVSNVRGGVALNEFRDWILGLLSRGTEEAPPVEMPSPVCKTQESISYKEATPTHAHEDEKCGYENYASEYIKSLY